MSSAAKTEAVETAATSNMVTDGYRRVLAALYLLFAIAASCRAAYQLAGHYRRAPLAYVLSAVAGAIYIAGAVTIRHTTARARLTTAVIASVEILGVLVVGTATIVHPSSFPDATVWSNYGVGYVFVPVALPMAALAWARRWRPVERC